MYRPNGPFNVAVKLLIPSLTKTKGIVEKEYTEYDKAETIFCSVKSYGGTTMSGEKTKDGKVVVVDTKDIECWYNEKIKSDCRIAFSKDLQYDIINEPENIEMRNQFMKFKIQRYNGNV